LPTISGWLLVAVTSDHSYLIRETVIDKADGGDGRGEWQFAQVNGYDGATAPV